MKRLVLIDGNAILHRAYHALPPLTAPDGSLVNAVYGFTAMIIRIYKDLAPSQIAVCFDRPKPTFRKKMFAGYQAKRPKMDEELAGQIEKIHDVVRAFGLPVFEKDGFEADDVIGTLAKQASMRQSVSASMTHIDQIIIVTGDKDILQLVNDKVFVYMPTKGLSEAKLYKEKEVQERMGVPPKLIPDLKGLMGDSSDNYPGVPGIGPKTALKLLAKHKTLRRLLLSDDLTKEQKDSARLSYDLATIHTDVPLDIAIDNPITSLDTPDARKILSDLHFHSLLKRLEGSKSDEPYKVKRSRSFVCEPKEKKSEQQVLF